MSVIKKISIKDTTGAVYPYDIGGNAQNVDYSDTTVKNKLDGLGSAAYKNAGVANGVATLDPYGKIPDGQLPASQGINNVVEGFRNPEDGLFYEEISYITAIQGAVDIIYIDLSTNTTYRYDANAVPAFVQIGGSGSGGVQEYESSIYFPSTGETNVIYIDDQENCIYRQDPSSSYYTIIGVSLGENWDNAYRGDLGKIAYDHSQLVEGNPHNVTKTDIGLSNVGNYKSLDVTDTQVLNDEEQEYGRKNLGLATIKGYAKNVEVSRGDNSVIFYDSLFNSNSIIVSILAENNLSYTSVTPNQSAHTITITYNTTGLTDDFKVTLIVLIDGSIITTDTVKYIGFGEVLINPTPVNNE